MNMRTLSEREEKLLWLTGFLLIACCMVIFIIRPLAYEDRLLSYKMQRARNQIVVCQNMAVPKNQDKPLPSHEPGVAMLAELESLAKAASVSIIDIRQQSFTQSPSNYKETKFELRCEGSIESLVRFMYSLGKADTLFTINRLQVSPKVNANMLEADLYITGMSIQ